MIDSKSENSEIPIETGLIPSTDPLLSQSATTNCDTEIDSVTEIILNGSVKPSITDRNSPTLKNYTNYDNILGIFIVKFPILN